MKIFLVAQRILLICAGSRRFAHIGASFCGFSKGPQKSRCCESAQGSSSLLCVVASIMGRDVSAEGGLVSQNADYAPVSAVSNRGKSIVHGKEGANEGSHQNVRGGFFEITLPLSPRSHCSFSGWGLPFRCLTSLSTGLLNPASWPLGSLSLSATPWGTSLPFCGTAKSRLFFCGEDSSFLCALLWQQV